MPDGPWEQLLDYDPDRGDSDVPFTLELLDGTEVRAYAEGENFVAELPVDVTDDGRLVVGTQPTRAPQGDDIADHGRPVVRTGRLVVVRELFRRSAELKRRQRDADRRRAEEDS